jgi:FkbM family methyltransferase
MLTMQTSFSPTEIYDRYLQSRHLTLNSTAKLRINQILEATNWDAPDSAIAGNNLAVIALIEAEQCNAPTMRGMYLETALEFLSGDPHPLSVAHLAVLQALVGETDSALQKAFSALIELASLDEPLDVGLVYLPKQSQNLESILLAENGLEQAKLLLTDAIVQAQQIFYNESGRRFLNLAAQAFPHSSSIHLKLGVAQLINQQWEGLLHLHEAYRLTPTHPQTLQALYLAYRDLGDRAQANFWLDRAQAQSWTTCAIADLTYMPFETKTQIAVEASFRSIVTCVLLAESDWFEYEMEFWRNSIQPGMTVIDVGANVGVYTFSAANQVGSTGRVIAIEPFSGCVRSLEETCRINQFSQVTVCAGAASDRNGILKLAVQASSELNEVVSNDVDLEGNYEAVKCFTLDSLIESQQLTRLDYLKIDAEGHEMQVLEGCDRILQDFKPVILYENIAGSKGSNLPVADYLIAKGYHLFRYQPYVQQLIAIDSVDSLHGNLNVIAIHNNL